MRNNTAFPELAWFAQWSGQGPTYRHGVGWALAQHQNKDSRRSQSAWLFIKTLILLFAIQTANATDITQRERGAVFFKNYCAGCHSLRYMPPDAQAGLQSLTTISMPATDARQWFGLMPPDLSLKARERGPEWLYTYLTSFYADHTRPFGANNRLVPDVAMPNVLAPLRGQSHLNDDLHDVISFLVYVAEPSKTVRYRIGFAVCGFLVAFGVLMYRLNVLYWRDIS